MTWLLLFVYLFVCTGTGECLTLQWHVERSSSDSGKESDVRYSDSLWRQQGVTKGRIETTVTRTPECVLMLNHFTLYRWDEGWVGEQRLRSL